MFKGTVQFGRRSALASALMWLLVIQLAWPNSRVAAREEDGGPLLLHAAQAMSGLSSFHFELMTVRGKTRFMENLELVGFEGDVQRPDRFRASVTARALNAELTVDVVGIGTHLWVSDPLAPEPRYIEVDLAEASGDAQRSIADALNPDRMLLVVVGLIEEPIVGGTEEVNGIATTRIDGFFDPARFRPIGTAVAETEATIPLIVSVWIDAEGLVHRVEFIGPMTEVESADVVRRLDLSAFNEPVEITAPV